MKGLIALNVQVAMALIEVNEDKELITKRVAESWIWPRQNPSQWSRDINHVTLLDYGPP